MRSEKATKADDSKEPSETIGEIEWITIQELIARTIKVLRQAHERGWTDWGGANERPRNYKRPSEAAVLQHLDDMAKGGVIVTCQDPSKDDLGAILCEPLSPSTYSSQLQSRLKNARRLPPVSPWKNSITLGLEWMVPVTELDRACAHLVPWSERQGQYDAAAEWKRSEGRLTPIEVADELKLIPESKDAYDFATKLAKAAWAGEIPAFAPGRRVQRVYTPEEIQRSPVNFGDEFYRTDLDNWLKKNEPRNPIKFGDPPMTEMMSKMVTAFKRVLQRGRRPSARNVGLEIRKHHSFVAKHWAEIQRRANDPVVLAKSKK